MSEEKIIPYKIYLEEEDIKGSSRYNRKSWMCHFGGC